MTRFLASVTDPDEAEIAVQGGADIIDLKDPARGALGALDVETVRNAVAAVAGRKPVSAVAGDVGDSPERLARAVEEMSASGVDYVKLALHASPQLDASIEALRPIAAERRLIGVLFADETLDLEALARLSDAGFAGAMIDTADKHKGRLLDHRDHNFLREFIRRARSGNLLVGLAGSLEAPDVSRLLPLDPDVLGFRGALCNEDDRRNAIDPRKLAAIRSLIPLESPDTTPRLASYRLLADRHYTRDERSDGATTDRVFVRDLVLPVFIGAYRHERNEPQRVRFNVVAEVRRRTRSGDDMEGLFSYDVITDAIRSIVSAGHVAVVETLAEKIAAAALEHEAVRGVVVRVEKLDIGPGAIGIEIERRKGSEAANILELFPTSIGSAGPKAAS